MRSSQGVQQGPLYARIAKTEIDERGMEGKFKSVLDLRGAVRYERA